MTVPSVSKSPATGSYQEGPSRAIKHFMVPTGNDLILRWEVLGRVSRRSRCREWWVKGWVSREIISGLTCGPYNPGGLSVKRIEGAHFTLMTDRGKKTFTQYYKSWGGNRGGWGDLRTVDDPLWQRNHDQTGIFSQNMNFVVLWVTLVEMTLY